MHLSMLAKAQTDASVGATVITVRSASHRRCKSAKTIGPYCERGTVTVAPTIAGIIILIASIIAVIAAMTFAAVAI